MRKLHFLEGIVRDARQTTIPIRGEGEAVCKTNVEKLSEPVVSLTTIKLFVIKRIG